MATSDMSNNYLSFFQRRILRMVSYWLDHEAIKNVDIAILDRERETILKAITFGLDYKPTWSIVSSLIIAFTPCMERSGHWAAWEIVLHRAISLSQELEDIDKEITLTALLARLHKRKSQSKETIYYYRRVIHLARQVSNQFEQARACSNLGYLYIGEGNWWRSEVLSCYALKMFERLDSDHGRAHSHNHLGLLYVNLNRWSDAEYHLRNACKIWRYMNDNYGLLYGLENLGHLFCEMEQPSQALIYLEQAVSQIKLSGEKVELVQVWINMGVAHRQKGDLIKSEEFLLLADEILKKFPNSSRQALVWLNLGKLKVLQDPLC